MLADAELPKLTLLLSASVFWKVPFAIIWDACVKVVEEPSGAWLTNPADKRALS